jgi:putative transposase
MSQYLRPKSKAASIFFTVALAQRGDDLLLREIERLRQAVRLTRAERPFRIDAWVVLPDHLHAIWTLPQGDGDYATRWRLIKARFSAGVPKASLRASQTLRSERGIWQRRFWDHHLRNDEDFAAHLKFCRDDPVLHGLADAAGTWLFSSFYQPERLKMAG